MNSFALHVLAMLLMLCDHLQLTLLPELPILRCVGRLAFPLFAFMAVEGYLRTRNLKNYLLRLLMLAVISEIPFDLLVSGSVFYPVHQNVIWTIVLGLCCIWAFENIAADRHVNTNDCLAVPHEGFDLDIRRGLEHIRISNHVDNVLHHRSGILGGHTHNRSVIQHTKIDVSAETIEERADRLEYIAFYLVPAPLEFN